MKTFKRLFIDEWIGEVNADQAEQELLEAIEKDDGWVKIEEGCEMPKSGQLVLCLWTDNNITIEKMIDDYGHRYLAITHWRELPNTPKS